MEYRYSQYLGKFTPQNLLFNANLQEFSQKVTYINNLQREGRISSQKCYEEISKLYQQLKDSFESLGIKTDE